MNFVSVYSAVSSVFCPLRNIDSVRLFHKLLSCEVVVISVYFSDLLVNLVSFTLNTVLSSSSSSSYLQSSFLSFPMSSTPECAELPVKAIAFDSQTNQSNKRKTPIPGEFSASSGSPSKKSKRAEWTTTSIQSLIELRYCPTSRDRYNHCRTNREKSEFWKWVATRLTQQSESHFDDIQVRNKMKVLKTEYRKLECAQSDRGFPPYWQTMRSFFQVRFIFQSLLSNIGCSCILIVI